ncbi:MAG: ABC transporter substrate-binding protein [Candidatus Krumholzibacteria bacterium]|nr:ABC transporter substrate-binding protein [Candidatus Krumholzibacteria bacterium]
MNGTPLILGASLLAALASAGCGGEREPDALRLALETEPSTLDPAFAVDYSSGLVSSLIHGTLVAFEPDGTLAGQIASRWTVSDDGLEYVFIIGGARFSDGTPVTARGAARSLMRLLDPSTASPRWWVLEPVRGAASFHAGKAPMRDGIEAADDTTLIIRLERPASHLPSLLAMPAAGIVPAGIADSLGRGYGRAPVGSGPWRLASWAAGDEIVLERNPFAERPPRLERILMRVIPEPMTRIAEFEVGNLDLLEVPVAEIGLWRSAGPELLSGLELRVGYIGLNTEKAPLDDRRVRRALNMAVDVDAIIEHVLFGAARRADGVVPPPLRRGPPPPRPYRFDPAAAAALLAEAGYPEGFAMEIWQRENPEAGRVLEAVQGYLGAVGVEARIVTREWSAFKEAVDRGTPDAFYLDWFADYPDPENFLVPLFHSSNRGGGGNRSRYADRRVDSLLDAAAALSDPDRRWLLYREAEEIVTGDAPWIFLWFPVRHQVVSSRLAGYRMPVIFNGQRFTEAELR